jgi:xanthine dehydrogenase accessory factor
MVMRPDGAFHGTIGGGQLEWQMLQRAQEALRAGRGPARFVDQALGPDLGQCCGGRVTVLIETFDRRDAAALRALAQAERTGPFEVDAKIEPDGRVGRDLVRPGSPTAPGERGVWREIHGSAATPLYLFGAGHVGRALVLALAPLPFAVRWIDSRSDAFPRHVPTNVTAIRTSEPTAELAGAPDDAFIAVMTHEHPLDLAITADALARAFPFVGLIGSDTKRARFEKRFRELGLPDARIGSLVCPIGLPEIRGKEPAVIAASVVAQLLSVREKGARPAFERRPIEADLTV